MKIQRITSEFKAWLSKSHNSINKKLDKIWLWVAVLIVACGGFISANYIEVNPAILGILINSSAIIFGFIIAYLLSSYSAVQQLRAEKLNRFASLQEELRPYQRAFHELGNQLMRKHNQIDFMLHIPIKTLKKDITFYEKNENAETILFVRALYEFGQIESFIPNFETAESIIMLSQLDKLYEDIVQANGLLSRYKYYKYILKSFNLPETQDLSAIRIADATRNLRIVSAQIGRKTEDIETLEFWYDQICAATDIVEKMKTNGKYVYSFSVPFLYTVMNQLIGLALFGVIIPVLLLASVVDYHSEYIAGVVNATLLGFVAFFVLAIIIISQRITNPQFKLIP